jgi:hypothetical protein
MWVAVAAFGIQTAARLNLRGWTVQHKFNLREKLLKPFKRFSHGSRFLVVPHGETKIPIKEEVSLEGSKFSLFTLLNIRAKK